MIGFGILIFFVLFCFVGPLIYHTNQIDTNDSPWPTCRPPALHLLGTDGHGFDELGRIMKGGQASLEIGFFAAFVAIVIGTLFGAVSGLIGGLVDSTMMRVVDVFLSVPFLFVVLILAVKFGATVLSLSLVIGFFAWQVPARLVRGEVLTMRERDYVLAARTAGAGRWRLISRHLLPNALGVVIVNVTFQVADAILAVSYVGFLGFGLHYPNVDWGDQLSDGQHLPAGRLLVADLPGRRLHRPDRDGTQLHRRRAARRDGRTAQTALARARPRAGGSKLAETRGIGLMAPVLDIQNLSTHIKLTSSVVQAVGNIDLHVDAGETLGVVGESGCGKSMTGLSIMGLLPPGGSIVGGSIKLDGRELVGLKDEELRRVRGNEIAMIFQDPLTSLDPTKTIGYQVAEPVRLHRNASKAEALDRAVEVLGLVGLPRPKERLKDYPHQLSGGLRQRVMIAMALACEPKLLIADEPTTALDVTIQAQILALLRDLKERLGMAMLLITHDMGVIAGHADRVNVMYAGRVVETAEAATLFDEMHHPYTQALLASIPHLNQDARKALHAIPGLPPDLARLPAGCRFAPRCSRATDKCHAEEPSLAGKTSDHLFSCWHPVDGPLILALIGEGRARRREHGLGREGGRARILADAALPDAPLAGAPLAGTEVSGAAESGPAVSESSERSGVSTSPETAASEPLEPGRPVVIAAGLAVDGRWPP